MPGANGGQKRVPDPVELELQIFVSHHVGAGNGTPQLLLTAEPSLPSVKCLRISYVCFAGTKPPAGSNLREERFHLTPGFRGFWSLMVKKARQSSSVLDQGSMHAAESDFITVNREAVCMTGTRLWVQQLVDYFYHLNIS